jgi:putative peptide zinc metalloprotease protein
MTTLADSLRSASARKLALRKRPDLTARRHVYQGRGCWVVKEPLGLNYFRFKDEEYALLQMLDGRSSLDDIKSRFEAEFPPQRITLEEIQQFLSQLHRCGLVIADAPGQGQQLKERYDKWRRQRLLQLFTNLLALRFRGIDPQGILDFGYPFIRWMFLPLCVLLCCLLGLSALALVVVQFDVFQSRLPAFHQFFSPQNAFWLLLTMAGAKVLHEFGHGFTCRHFGGECHEMGVMLLVLTPCLYCNVSDSWMLPSKWRRAAIGAAGMYVEMIIASLATFAWWFSEPGLLNNICLSLMFVCSVSTVVFNANPLLRYDGYYILSDLLEIPNLRQKSTAILTRKLSQWCLGIDPPDDPLLPQRHQVLFIIYSVAAAIYRWVVLLSILWFLYKVFEPYRLQVIGQAIALASISSLIGVPAYQVYRFFHVPGRVEKVKRGHVLVSLALLAAAVAAFIWVPLPYRVICPLETRAYAAMPVYVEVEGTLERLYVRPGLHVEAGAKLAELSSLDVEAAIAELTGQRDLYAARLESLEHERFRNPQAGAQIGQIQEALAAAQQQLRQREQDRQRLLLAAPCAGIVLLPPEIPAQQPPDGQLPSLSGTPFDPKNQGCYLPLGVHFCSIGDPRQMEAVLVVDQADIEFVHEGDQVELKLDHLPHETFYGTIAEIARQDLKISPRQLSNKAGGELATKTDAAGIERPQSTSYQALVRIEAPYQDVPIGIRGRAKIHAGTQTLGQRLWRFLCTTFRFE